MRKVLVICALVFVFSLNLYFVEGSFSGSANTYVVTSMYSCVATDTTSYWRHTNGSIENIYFNGTMVQNANATKYFNDSDDYCCPNKYSYNVSSGQCFKDESNPINACADLETEETCEGAPNRVAYSIIESWNESDLGVCGSVSDGFLIEGGAYCTNATSCMCSWDDQKNVCKPKREIEMYCGPGNALYNKSCVWTEVRADSAEDECAANGKMIINFIASGTALGVESWCINQTKEYPCSVAVELPFFDKTTLVMSVLGICLIYMFLNKKILNKK